MNLVHIITATAIAFGTTTAASAAAPSAQFAPAVYNADQSANIERTGATAEIIKVSGNKYHKKQRKAQHRQEQRRAERRQEQRRAERHREARRHHDRHHRSDKSDKAKILGLLGAAAIIANSN